MEYSWGGVNLSRWQYVDKLFEHCMKNDRCSDLLGYLFGKNQFRKALTGLPADEIDVVYQKIIKDILAQINGILYFGGHELRVFI